MKVNIKRFKYTILTAFDSIKTNAVRSFLTVLGIVIGVASIILIMSLGEAAENLILGEINQMGAETVVALPGELTDETSIFSDSLTQKDVDALSRTSNVPNLVNIMPAVVVPGELEYLGETYSPAVMLGAEADFFSEVFNVFPNPGSNFTEFDVDGRSRVVIIGSKVKEELFGNSNAIGERVTIKDNQFRVVGVYPQIGQRGLFDMDDLALMPYTTAQTYLLGTNYFHRIIMQADSADNVDKMAYDVRATLRESHGLDLDREDDFDVLTQQGLVDGVSIIVGALTAFLASAVAIALVVGGIGVMNIMLVSVTERTKEIGLRKALGATKKAIMQQFLWEAVVLTLVGGVIGVILGAALSYLASIILSQVLVSGWSFSFPVFAAILGVVVSTAVGLIFGLYPAKKAAEKSPIEALRYE
ncbi:MAG: ABC transporter permease [Candidatus Paceibacterota bacterium]